MRVVIRISFLLALLASLSGCMLFTTKKEGNTLRREVRTLSGQVAALRKREKATLAELRKAYGELKELKEILPRARQILLRSSAQFGLRLDRLASDVAKLKGKVDDLSADLAGARKVRAAHTAALKGLAETAKRLQVELTRLITEVRKERAEPRTAAEWWARATVARLSGRLPEAERAYRALIQKFPADPRVPEAYYRIAQMHFEAYAFRKAIVAVARLLRAKPGSRFDAAARLLSAKAYFELKRCKRAIRILARLVRVSPNAEPTPKARALLKRLLRIQNVSRFCSR
jgi:TolA-binding protein